MKKNLMRKVLWVVIVLAVIVVTVCFIYYAIPNSTVQSIVTTIVAAVYGGLLTLLGVAWTIKNGDKDRKEDELKKYFPYIKLVDTNKDDYKTFININNILNKEYGNEALTLNEFYNYSFSNFSIKNIAESIIILESLELDGNTYPINKILEKNSRCQIITYLSHYESWKQLTNFNIIVKDILGNKYKVVCTFNKPKDDEVNSEEFFNELRKKFTYYPICLKITAISLPELIKEGK